MMTEHAFSAQILPTRGVLRVAGHGALAFLHNLLTANVASLTPGQAAYGALLTPQGKILHDVFVLADADGALVDCASVQAEGLLQKLRMYRLRAKLELEMDATRAVAVAADGSLGAGAYADPRLAAMGTRAVVPAGSLATGTGYDSRRIALGLADSAADIGSGEMFVQEANLDLLAGVSFTKGCYVGQEVVSRTHHRGTARSRILPVRLDGPAAHGAEVTSGGVRVGSLLSFIGENGLALLRLDRLADATAPLLTDAGRLHVHKPGWMTLDLPIAEVAR